ncbi:hypothetical protein SFUMM280S_02302 [Streptomyces fumanus]
MVDPPGGVEEAAVLRGQALHQGAQFLGVALGGQLRGDRVDGQPEDHGLGRGGHVPGAVLGEPHPGQSAQLRVAEDLPQRGLGLGADQGEGLLAAEPAQRCPGVGAARRGQQLPGGGQRLPAGQPVLGLGVRGARRERGGAVEQRVGALVGEVPDGRRVEPGLQQPGPQPVQAERGEPHHAVAGHVGVVDGRRGLLAGVGHQLLVDRPVRHQPDRLQQPELVVQLHHRLGDPLQHGVAGLLHAVGDQDGGGQRGQRHRGVAGRVLADGEQVQVGEHPVEELRLGLGVPVHGGQVQLALALGHRVDQRTEVGHAGVGEDRLQGGQPDAEHVPRGAAGDPGQLLAGRDGARLLVGDLDQPRVHGHPPRLARLGGGVAAGQPQRLGRRRELLLGERAARVDTGVRPGPAGEPDGPGEQGGGERVAGQLRFGVQPRGRQGGAV